MATCFTSILRFFGIPDPSSVPSEKDDKLEGFYDDPLPAPAPSQGPCVLVAMRHSVRVDKFEGGVWADQAQRPYDSPISDYELPQEQALILKQYNIKRIVSSPFRRCIQTAGVIADVLEIGEVQVHTSLGEVMNKVKAQLDSQGLDSSSFHYLDSDGMQLAAGKASIKMLSDDAPLDTSELIDESLNRFRECFELMGEQVSSDGASTLLVTHGDAINTFVQLFLGTNHLAYDTDECCWVAVDIGTVWQSKEALQHARLQLMNIG